MKKWYFDLDEFNVEKGFKFQFLGESTEHHPYLHLCEITEVIPKEKLSYSWRYDGYNGNSLVTWKILKTEKNNLLRLTHHDLEIFPSDNPDFNKNNFQKGWDDIILPYLNS